ncbi:MAG: hypothetical protein V1854_04720 [Methanobacteriota archaeon]
MTNDNDFTSRSVLFADILGFSKLTLKQREQAENKLRAFIELFANLVKKYDDSNISAHNIGDSVVVGFKNIPDALSFSKNLFYESFDKEIALRGTIGIGEFTHKPNSDNKFSFTIGSGLVLATMSEKYHIKGHTLLLVCEVEEAYETEKITCGHRLTSFEDEEIHDLPKEFKAYIVPWWKKEDNKKTKDEIDKRIKKLDCEIIKYLEKTRKHVEDFTFQDGNMTMDDF